MDKKKLLFVSLTLSGLSACVPPLHGIVTSDERRIWVLQDGKHLYRCADAGGPDQPPMPVCVRAPLASGQ